jgi:hypothetical protein
LVVEEEWLPFEAWNPVMHANSGQRADWREFDGDSFDLRGHGKIAWLDRAISFTGASRATCGTERWRRRTTLRRI